MGSLIIVKQDIVELILRARSGQESAFAELKDIYRPLIEASVRRFRSDVMSYQDGEDLYQEALVHFCNSVCSYDCGSDGVEFGLYAKICIDNGLVSFIRAYNRRNRLRAVSLEEQVEPALADAGDLLSSIVERERMAMLVRQINKQLSDLEKRVWWMYVSGASVSTIADKIGIENKSVSNAIYRIRKKLKDTLGGQK